MYLANDRSVQVVMSFLESNLVIVGECVHTRCIGQT